MAADLPALVLGSVGRSRAFHPRPSRDMRVMASTCSPSLALDGVAQAGERNDVLCALRRVHMADDLADDNQSAG